MTIDENFKQLEEILQRMEQNTQSLEEAFQDYERGMKLIRECNSQLADVEKKLLILNTQTGQLEEA